MTTSVKFGGAVPQLELRHRILLARDYAGLEQSQLAELAGISRRAISNAERGVTKPRRPMLLAIAMATGVDSTWLEYGKTPVQDDPDGGKVCAIRESNPEPTVIGSKPDYAA